jgi:hypothetical protein
MNPACLVLLAANQTQFVLDFGESGGVGEPHFAGCCAY